MKIGVETDHHKSLGAYIAAGHEFPAIPQGANTVWHHFKTVEGLNAVIINQRGFTPLAGDDEQQVNGCAIAVAIDPPDDATARVTLERWVIETLELEK